MALHIKEKANLAQTLTKLIICAGILQYSKKRTNNSILIRAHSAALGVHKGVKNTYNRIRQLFGGGGHENVQTIIYSTSFKI